MLNEQMPDAANDQGEYRELRPDEIAACVRAWRERLGLKQINLASQAHVDERTIQRIEHSKHVSDESLQRVGKALGLTEMAFVGPRYIPTKAEAERIAKDWQNEWEKKWALVDVHVLDGQWCFESIIGAQAFHVDDQDVTDDGEELVAALRDQVMDWNCVYGEIPATSQLDARRDLFEHVTKIEQLGYALRYGTYDAAFGPQRVQVKVAVILIIKRDNTEKCAMKKMMVPRQHSIA